jgi:hypothetical protein
MNQPEKTLVTELKRSKKKKSKKTIAERLAGKTPFAWLKVDTTIPLGK